LLVGRLSLSRNRALSLPHDILRLLICAQADKAALAQMPISIGEAVLVLETEGGPLMPAVDLEKIFDAFVASRKE
jgi:hypothetical protein